MNISSTYASLDLNRHTIPNLSVLTLYNCTVRAEHLCQSAFPKTLNKLLLIDLEVLEDEHDEWLVKLVAELNKQRFLSHDQPSMSWDYDTGDYYQPHLLNVKSFQFRARSFDCLSNSTCYAIIDNLSTPICLAFKTGGGNPKNLYKNRSRKDIGKSVAGYLSKLDWAIEDYCQGRQEGVRGFLYEIRKKNVPSLLFTLP